MMNRCPQGPGRTHCGDARAFFTLLAIVVAVVVLLAFTYRDARAQQPVPTQTQTSDVQSQLQAFDAALRYARQKADADLGERMQQAATIDALSRRVQALEKQLADAEAKPEKK